MSHDQGIELPKGRKYASVEDLSADRIGAKEEDYQLPGVGWIRIRGLSRAEFLESGKRFGDDPAGQERYVLSRAVIIPRVTEADAAQWQKSSGMEEINALWLRINELSGLSKGADKSGLPGV